MDPYLERHWLDVHSRLVTLASDALNLTLPAELVARVEERVVVDSVEYVRPRAIFRAAASEQAAIDGDIAVAEPIVLELEAEQHPETYVTILDVDGGRLIAVIEFLSPSNKVSGEARDEYRKKRDELVKADVNFIEIDLVRQGAWRELLRPWIAPAEIQTAYRVITRRIHPKRQVELYPVSLRRRLPTIWVPLRQHDPDALLDLQALHDHANRNGRYDRTDYTQPCTPPLEREDAAWADEVLRKAGARAAS